MQARKNLMRMENTAAQSEDAAAGLETLGLTLGWLLVLITGVLLSFRTTARQRDALCLSLAGEEEAAREVGCVLPTRRLASVLVTLALTFFFLLSLEAEEQARCGGDCAALRSARLNRWASFLVLVAAVLRLIDVGELCRQAEEETV